ncbi:uncharacterized protein LOC142178054 [Nicotiana tabacum]|uniref:Uncharacterized protein LOC142178054 n=1 Tax=Nicotiana tabacum TaxID=4097 RepID=A0AC58U1X1_TOBAC
MARIMILDHSLPNHVWAEAVSTTCHILNRCLIRPILKKTPYELWKSKWPNIGYFHPFGSKCFIHNNGKDNLGKYNPRSDEEESVHVIFDENNTTTEKGIIADDEDISQEASHASKSQMLTGESASNQTEPQKESTTPAVGTRPNEWRSEPEYPQKFIIGDPSEGMKIRGALKKKANIALISQIKPKKVEEALKGSSWVQAMQDELDQLDKNQVWELLPKLFLEPNGFLETS